ncbi:hypothetical protein TrLO_g7310 [Triparma laevis f. longispina]|uniref:G-protein coupled receptors family 2 profile 2 domain-containing protein n=1 Tax=Triparma laevis f. longispina TaxID=1714387 RepID=A0A9W6ZCL7_9STRA|nr:hypothetical protein TrLO_g7310 [Triparma laevis f. longispina]
MIILSPPARLLADKEGSCVDLARGAVTGFTWLSGILVFLLIMVELNRKKFRDFPQNLPLIFATVALCFNLSLGIGPASNFRQINEYETSEFWHDVCHLQSFLYQFCGVATLFWYTALTNLMYKIIAKNERIAELRENQRKYYVAGFIIPVISASIPIAFDAYGPRSGDLECWLDDWHWQFGLMYGWVGLAALFGIYRSWYIIKVLKKTSYKAKRSRQAGAMESKRGHTVMSTLKEHMIRQVFFVFLYVMFAVMNLVYFIWSSIAQNNDPGDIYWDESCVLTMIYAMNTSCIGTYIAMVFGVTKENIKAAKYYYRAWRSGNGSGLGSSAWTESDLTSPMVEPNDMASGGTGGERGDRNQLINTEDLEDGLRENLAKNGANGGLAGPATSLGGTRRASSNVVKTHLGTNIDARLGLIRSPIEDCTSTFDPRAVSGTSVPPLNHPMTAKLEEMRDHYTRNVLAYVLERIEVLALDESIGRRFMEEITTQSHILFDASTMSQKYRQTSRNSRGNSFDDFSPGDSDSESFWDDVELPTEEDLDARLAKAKEKFEEVIDRAASRDGGGMIDDHSSREGSRDFGRGGRGR